MMDHKRGDMVKVRPLTEISTGQTVYFAYLDAGRTAKARMLSMGLRRGTPFKLTSNNLNSPFVISLSGSRMVLGRGVTDKIMVTEEKPE